MCCRSAFEMGADLVDDWIGNRLSVIMIRTAWIDRSQCQPQRRSQMRVPALAAAAANMRFCLVKSASSRRPETPVLS
jgi:hypothetical protein